MSILDEMRSALSTVRQDMLSKLGVLESQPQVQMIESYAKGQAQAFLRSVVAEVLAGAAQSPPVSVAGFVELLLDALDRAEQMYVEHHAAVTAQTPSSASPAA